MASVNQNHRGDAGSLPQLTWAREDRTKDDTGRPKEGFAKAELLMRSLALVRGQRDNEAACRKVVEAALKARLLDVAAEAIRTFSEDAAFDLCVSVGRLLEDFGRRRPLDEGLVAYCECRVLDCTTCRSGFGFNGHFTDQRSRALGLLGGYRLIHGDPGRAAALWLAADDPRDVDEVIACLCETIAKKVPDGIEAALVLLEWIVTPTVKAEAMVALSQYA